MNRLFFCFKFPCNQKYAAVENVTEWLGGDEVCKPEVHCWLRLS